MRFRILFVLFALGFAGVYTAEGFLYRDYNLDEFQVATGYLKDVEPGLFPSDFIWSKAEMVRNLHVCVRRVMGFTQAVSGGLISEPIDLFLLWLPLCMVLFFVGIYLLCFEFTRDRWASLLVACMFMLVRRVPWDWWGLGPTFTMSARGTVLSGMPLILWCYFRYQDRLGLLAICFFLWGLLSNLHPLSGWGLVEFLGITILLAERFAWRAWIKVFVMGTVTLLGSTPFLVIWKDVVGVSPERQASGEVLKPFWNDFGGLELYPLGWFVNFFQDLLIPLLLCVVGYRYWMRAGKPGEPRAMFILRYLPFIVVGLVLFVMNVGYRLKLAGFSLPVMVPEHGRNLKIVYLSLCVWMAFGFKYWFERFRDGRRLIKWGVPIFVVLLGLTVNFPGHKLGRYLFHRAVGDVSGVAWLRKDRVRMDERLKDSAADLEVALWARDHTAKEALFYFDSYEFRYYARRSLVFCWFDRPCVAFRPTQELEEWVKRRDHVQPLKDLGESVGMWNAAQQYGADYLVLRKDWRPVPQSPVWSNSKYNVYRVKGQ
jgi:hypothetical protein